MNVDIQVFQTGVTSKKSRSKGNARRKLEEIDKPFKDIVARVVAKVWLMLLVTALPLYLHLLIWGSGQKKSCSVYL